MKKRRFKKWVVWTLIAINTLSLFVMGSDCEDMILFVISHIIAVLTFSGSSYLLLKNSEE